MKVAYCTGFWCTNVGNGFYSLGVEYVLKQIIGAENVTVVSDLQTYTTGYGRRLYPDKNQLEYISSLDVDYIVLAGPVISKYFLLLWKDIIIKLNKRGIGYILLSTGMMKMTEDAFRDIKLFFMEYPPFAFSSRDEDTYNEFGSFAKHSYNGICFSFFSNNYFNPAGLKDMSPYIIYNFDKICEPDIRLSDENDRGCQSVFEFQGKKYKTSYPVALNKLTAKTDRFTDALIYATSIFPGKKHNEFLGEYRIVRTDHRFHPHYRSKIYHDSNSFVADLPYGYINLYANAELTLSDRVHACAVTLAFGKSAMLFAKTNRHGLLERVGAEGIFERPVKLDMEKLQLEKQKQIEWLRIIVNEEN